LFVRNRVIVPVSGTTIVVPSSAMAGFALAQIPFAGRHSLLLVMFSKVMIPF
jgi:ABC-type glycerol-3-phosphate transport system permease component